MAPVWWDLTKIGELDLCTRRNRRCCVSQFWSHRNLSLSFFGSLYGSIMFSAVEGSLPLSIWEAHKNLYSVLLAVYLEFFGYVESDFHLCTYQFTCGTCKLGRFRRTEDERRFAGKFCKRDEGERSCCFFFWHGDQIICSFRWRCLAGFGGGAGMVQTGMRWENVNISVTLANCALFALGKSFL
jgi:hypothetical protein